MPVRDFQRTNLLFTIIWGKKIPITFSFFFFSEAEADVWRVKYLLTVKRLRGGVRI